MAPKGIFHSYSSLLFFILQRYDIPDRNCPILSALVILWQWLSSFIMVYAEMIADPPGNLGRQELLPRLHAQLLQFLLMSLQPAIDGSHRHIGADGQFLSCHCFHHFFWFLY